MSAYLPSMWASIGSDAFDRQIDGMFDDALRVIASKGQGWVPPCNAWEDTEGFYVEVALPGWDPKEVSLELQNQHLTIRGERKAGDAQAGKYHLRELGHDRFVRVFTLPAWVNQDQASATQKNGVLSIAFPKREEAKVRRIVIEGQ